MHIQTHFTLNFNSPTPKQKLKPLTKVHRWWKQIGITKIRLIWACFHPATGHFLLWARKVGANPWVSWEKKQFHIDNAATVKLHLAFADKSAPVTKEFSTPQAICAVHWTSESQQAPRHTRGIFLFRVEGWGNHSTGWAKGLDSYAPGRAEFLEWEWWEVRDPKVNWKPVISLTCGQLVEKIQIPVKGRPFLFKDYVSLEGGWRVTCG